MYIIMSCYVVMYAMYAGRELPELAEAASERNVHNITKHYMIHLYFCAAREVRGIVEPELVKAASAKRTSQNIILYNIIFIIIII